MRESTGLSVANTTQHMIALLIITRTTTSFLVSSSSSKNSSYITYSGTNTQRVKGHCRAVSPSRISHLDALLLLDRYAEVRHAGDVNLDDLSAVPGSV